MFDFLKTPADDIRKWSRDLALIATKAEEYDLLKGLVDMTVKANDGDPQHVAEVTIRIPKGLFFTIKDQLRKSEINVKKAEEGL